MRVKVIDSSIPEGYTYMRTDRFTAETFVQEVKAGHRKAAIAWTQANPKEEYTLDDLMQFYDEASLMHRKGRRTNCNRTVVSSTQYGVNISGRTSKQYSFGDDRN